MQQVVDVLIVQKLLMLCSHAKLWKEILLVKYTSGLGGGHPLEVAGVPHPCFLLVIS